MIRRDVLAGAAVAGGALGTSSIHADVLQYGARGDGIADDAPAIQAALDDVGRRGGGTVLLPPPPVHYLIRRGLEIPSFVTLRGPTQVRFPYSSQVTGSCTLMADFADPFQWVVQSRTRSQGRALAHDELVTRGLPDGVTYNCAVADLLISSQGPIPFGGVRMHGCPGAVVEGVGIDRVGCGLLVNYSFGGRFAVHVRPHYYGVAAWDDANANCFEIYCAHGPERPSEVPWNYRMAFMRQLDGHFADTLKLSTDAYGALPFGLLCGSTSSSSVGNTFDATIEHFAGGVLLFHAYATQFGRCYLESEGGRMKTGIAATRSRFGIEALHAYMSGQGKLFDFGLALFGHVFASGITYAEGFGKAPERDGTSSLTLLGLSEEPDDEADSRALDLGRLPGAWMALELEGDWRPAGEDYATPSVRWNPLIRQVELCGTIQGGRRGPCFLLDRRNAPAQRLRLLVAGGILEIAPDGQVLVQPQAELVSLDGATFNAA